MSIHKIFALLAITCSTVCSYSEASNSTHIFDRTMHASAKYTDFYNPMYNTYSDVQKTTITDGSMLNFAPGGAIGKTIRAAQSINDINNSLGLSHSGVIVVENPKWIFDVVSKKIKKTTDKTRAMTPDAGEAILKELREYYPSIISATVYNGEILAPFTLESDGSVREILHRVLPHVHIHALEHSVKSYDGNIYLRQLNVPINHRDTQDFVKYYLGSKYESLLSPTELLKATQGKNKTENTERLFCSELAALFYKKTGVISEDTNVSNITPEYFGTSAGQYDLLSGKASNEIALKEKYTFSDSDINGTSLWGYITKGFVKIMNYICD